MIEGGAVALPSRDAASQDAVNGTAVELFSSLSQKGRFQTQTFTIRYIPVTLHTLVCVHHFMRASSAGDILPNIVSLTQVSEGKACQIYVRIT